MKKLKLIGKTVFLFILALVLVRISWLDIFHIPGESMEGALKEGDLIVLNKGLYDGVFSNLLQKLGIEAYPKVNDIVVFRRTIADSEYYVKRCIGLPGDRIGIQHGQVSRNGSPMEDTGTVRHLYRLWYRNFSPLQVSLERHGIPLFGPGYLKVPGSIYLYMEEGQRRLISREPTIDSIHLERTDLFHARYGIYPLQGDEMAIIDSMPTFTVPFKKWKMPLDSAHWAVYGELIRTLEPGGEGRPPDSAVYHGNQGGQFYIFKNDYYFLMGDNRDLSVDSRYFGCIPKKLITGKLVFAIR